MAATDQIQSGGVQMARVSFKGLKQMCAYCQRQRSIDGFRGGRCSSCNLEYKRVLATLEGKCTDCGQTKPPDQFKPRRAGRCNGCFEASRALLQNKDRTLYRRDDLMREDASGINKILKMRWR